MIAASVSWIAGRRAGRKIAAPSAGLALALLAARAAAGDAAPPASYFDAECARLARLAASTGTADRIEACQGFRGLAHPAGEPPLLPLLSVPDARLRLHAARALSACGGRRAVEALIERLGDADWEVRWWTRTGLERMTAQAWDSPAAAKAWLAGSSWDQKEDVLRAALADADRGRARAALGALRFVGSARSEADVIRLGPGVPPDGPIATALALERIGGAASRPLLAGWAGGFPEACWALGAVGGPESENALLGAVVRWFDHDPSALINLDRLGSTNAWQDIGVLVRACGLVIYRSRTDDLQRPPTAFQRAAGNLILRTGRAQEVVDLVLAQCEGKRADAATPPELLPILAGMKPELQAGFIRNDGLTVAQPLAALPQIIRDPAFAPRLTALLDHPAYVVRIYAAESLARLRTPGAAEAILKAVRAPYPFPDATTQVSGKHFDRSFGVRWRGYLCIAIGKLGGDEARTALEAIATDAAAFRDVRYGATVGLRFIGAEASRPVLERVAAGDILREIRVEAAEAIGELDRSRAAGAPRGYAAWREGL